MILNDQLRQAYDAWQIKKDYEQQAISQIKQYNLDYRATGKYEYNAEIEKYILERETIDNDLLDFLGTQVYLSQQDIDNDKKQINANTLIGQGYQPLTIDLVKSAIVQGKKLKVKARMDCDIFSANIEQVYKPFITNDDKAMLLKPRAKTRGYYLSRFSDAFAQLV